MLGHLLERFAQRVVNWLKRLREPKGSCLNGKSILVKSETKLSLSREVKKDD